MVRELLPEARLGVVCNYVAPSVIPAARELQNGKNTVFFPFCNSRAAGITAGAT